MNLGTQKTFDHFVIEWERTNITNFKISVCDTEDGEYRDVYVKNDGENITSVTSDIQLDEAVTAQYVKLTVNGYTVNREAGSQYPCMSLRSLEKQRI